MDTPIDRAEHEEFRRRMEDEHKRIDHRLRSLEDTVRQIQELTASVEKLATNVEVLAKSQTGHEARIEAIEDRDGEKWRTVTSYVMTAVIGILLGYVFKLIGM